MVLDKLKGKVIVSCQALEDEPLHSSFIMGRMALAAKEGGASGIRAQSVADIVEIRKVVDLPIIGIIKRTYPDSPVYITPTSKEVKELLGTGCEIIALDATKRNRPNQEKIEDLLELIHQHKVLAMADCSTVDECLWAEQLGFDIISTTLFGYTDYSKNYDGPDFEAIKKILSLTKTPLIAEGKINTPSDLRQVMDCGIFSAVVGSAITRPQLITKKFVDALKG